MSAVPIQIEIRYQGKEKLLLVDELDFVVGRSSKLKVSIESNNISREHVRIQSVNGKIWITDLSSTNGTFMGGKRIQAQVSAEYKGEELCIGPLGEGVYLKLSHLKDNTRSLVSEALARAQQNVTNASIAANTVSRAPVTQLSRIASPASSSFPSLATQGSHTGTGISVDSGFLVNELVKSDPTSGGNSFGQGGGYGQGSGMPQLDGAAIEFEVRKKAFIELEKKRIAAERQLADMMKFRDQAETTIRLADDKRREFQRLEQQVHHYELQVREAQTKLQALEVETHQKITQLEKEFTLRLTAMQAEEKRQHDVIAHMTHQVAEAQRRRDQAELHFRAEDHRIEELREQLKHREAEVSRRRYEVQADVEKMQTESDFIKKRIMLETDTLQAEAQLRRAQVEKEIEDLRTRKSTTERELDAMLAKSESMRAYVESLVQEQQRLENENRNNHVALTELRVAVTNTENRKRQLEVETNTLADKINAANDESQRILNYGRSSADDTMRRATDEAKLLIEEGLRKVSDSKAKYDEEIRVFRAETERQLQAEHQKLLADVADDRRQAEEAVLKARADWEQDHARAKSAWEQEYKDLKAKAIQEQDAAQKAWQSELEASRQKEKAARDEWEKELAAEKSRFYSTHDSELKTWQAEMDSIKQKDMQALTQWRVEQDTKVQEKLSGDIGGLIHAVTSTALTKLHLQPNQMISQSELMNALEPAMKEALLSEASTHGPFNPNREASTKNFWVQFGKKSAAMAAVIIGIAATPKIVTTYFETVKANQLVSGGASDAFSKQLKEARQRLLELNLEVRPQFQPNYYENILYNDAYVEIKQDPNVQKEWVIKLYQFFFEVLQMPDRIVVDFIPLESSTVRGLAELRKSMNSKTFKTNLEQMKALEKKKLEQEIFPLLSNNGSAALGKKNWERLRQLESEFYQEKLRSIASRQLATEAASSSSEGSSP